MEMAESASTQPPSTFTVSLSLSTSPVETVLPLTTTIWELGDEPPVIAAERKPKEKDAGSDLMIIFIAGAVFIFVVGAALAIWYVYDRRRRMEKFKLITKMANEESKKRKKKKRRLKLSRGPKPVIKVKPNEELKKALNEFLEMQTQTIGSVADDDELAKKDSLRKSKRRAAAAGGSISLGIHGSQDTTETKSSQDERVS
ncbi:hypothetical protein ANCCAN_00778 [Ancylostoma caninum]|uniref:Uncharacterized protein n=1 Tax=Ancylostoma caninum TaxID=29170 RepID=A0A368H9D8_ANCCA|nr:hypothetical protein ANCCAN_00778 [Ancylostoma caninum]